MKNYFRGIYLLEINKSQYAILIILFLISIFLRTYLLSENLFFGPEQGIDFTVIKRIAIEKDLTLIGAKTDISGVFHGPIYYYLAVIPFLITNGNPVWISYFFIFLNSSSVFILYYLGKELFNKRVGMIAAFLFTFSYGAIVYSRWLSSHPLSILLSSLLFIFILRFFKNKTYSIYGVAICYALLGQAEFLNFLFFAVIILLIIFVYKKHFLKVSKVYLFTSITLLTIFSTANYILFDIRNNFLISRSLLGLLYKDSGYYISFTNSFIDTVNHFVFTYSQFVLPVNMQAAVLILVIGLIFLSKDILHRDNFNILLIIWLITPVLILIILRHNILEQFFVALSPAYLLLTAFITDYFMKKRLLIGSLFFAVMLSTSVFNWYLNIPENKNIFFQAPQPRLRYIDQLKVIKYIYEQSGNKPFSYQAYTIPYWMPQAWDYLFWYYAVLNKANQPLSLNSKHLFVIIQEDLSNAGFQKDWLDNTVVKWGYKIKEERIGILTVQQLLIQ